MKRIVVSGVLIVVLSISATSQGLFKLRYQYYGPDSTVYDAVLAWYGPAQPSTMRIKYYEPGSRTTLLVEQGIIFIPQPLGFVLRGADARFVLPPPPGIKYAPDSFIFGLCPNGTFPCVSTVDDAGSVGALAEFRPVSVLEAGSLLQQFGFVAPSAIPNSVPRPNTTVPSGVTMHLIVVADTDASDIGANDQIDANSIVREFRIAANEIGIRFSPTIVSGSSFSQSVVLNTLNGLRPGSNDIVVFAYSGHGFRLDSDNDPYPRLNLARDRKDPNSANLQASEVFNILKRKGARLNITLVDACNERLGRTKFGYQAGYSLKDSASGVSSNAVAALFLNTRGNIIAAAASRGELAGTDDKGGYFTRSFLDAFRAETSLAYSSSPTWLSIITNANNAALLTSRKKQNVAYYIE